MEKSIVIITGASGGVGKEFTAQMMKENPDEIWAIARNKEKLERLKQEWGSIIRPIPLDLSDLKSFDKIKALLEKEKPNIRYLINNAGLAKFANYNEFTTHEMDQTIDVNCKAPIFLTHLAIPYMKAGSHIINMVSAASFQPAPYINLYCSSKVFELFYSRALALELKEKKISVTASCPLWMKTEMLPETINGKKVNYIGIMEIHSVVKKAISDAKKGKDLSCASFANHFLRFSSKIFSHRFIMNCWKQLLKKYL